MGFSGNIFHPRLLVQRFFSLGAAEITTPAADIFKNVRTTTDSVIGIRKDSHTIKPVALVSKSGRHEPINSSDHNMTYISPDPIKVDTFISAEDLIKFETYTGDRKQAFLDEQLRKLQLTYMVTKNSMASQALKQAAYYWPKRANDGKLIMMNTSLGSKTTVTANNGDWDDSGTTLEDIWEDVRVLKEDREDAGFSTWNIRCGRNVFNALSNKVTQLSNDARVAARVEPGSIYINGVEFIDDRLRFRDLSIYNAASTSQVVDDDYLMATSEDDMNGAFQTIYGPIYNTKAGLRPAQMWVDREEAPRGEGFYLYLEATPIFIMNPEGIAEMKVTNNT